jgi:GNAT superfamily N-acetyltransferase
VNRTQGDYAPARATATIRRPDSGDLAALTCFFSGLSIRTRVQRFFAPVWPTAALIRLACGWADEGRAAGEDRVGGSNARGRGGHTDALVATIGGDIIGHAMAADPAGLVTEIGVVVADAWQGQGVGSALVRALISRARARGVTSLSMDVLPGNRDVLAMIAGHWTAARTHRGADCVTIRAGLAPDQADLPSGGPGRGRPAEPWGGRAQRTR